MNLVYRDIFALRGNRYHAAMLRYPDARAAEFEALFAKSPVRAGDRVLDIPAGGGYLARHLPPGADLVSLELTEGFGTGTPLYAPGQPWTLGRFDRIVCLAALHHIDDAAGFMRGLMRQLKTGGILHVADVAHGSPLGRFLDGFVGNYNVTGHEGSYLSSDLAFWNSIGTLTRLQETPCPWTFSDEREMLEFCSLLFGLVDCPSDLLLDALRTHVGVRHTAAGVVLEWRLLYADVQLDMPLI